MSSCSGVVDKAGKPLSLGPHESLPAGARAVTTRLHVFDTVRPTDPRTWPDLVAFIWPLAFVLLAWKRPASRLTKALWFTEPLLLGGSLYTIQSFMLFGHPDVGAYVGRIGVAVYSLGWVGEALSKWRSRRDAHRARAGSSLS